MRNAFVLATLLLASAMPLMARSAQSSESPGTGSAALALVGGTIYVNPTAEPIKDGVVLIKGEDIVALGTRAEVQVPPGVRVIDCSGLTITAGFWNSHVHFFEKKWANAGNIPAAELAAQLQDMLTRFGFTSVFDLGSTWENTRRIRDRIEAGEVPGPRIRSTGEALVAPGALPSQTVLNMMGLMPFPAPEVSNAQQASAAAKKLLDEGVDGIKVHLQPPPAPKPPMPEEAMAAAIREAHKAGKPAFVHPNTAADVMAAVRDGVDVVAHTTPRSGPWNEELISEMKAHNVALTPTLTLWKFFLRHERISVQQKMVSTAVDQLRMWVASGGTVLFGTDLGAVDYDPSDEYALMAEAGMNFRQILASLTTAPADRFGDSKHLGQVRAGFQADMAVLKGDPASDIHALTAVRYTLRAGKIIYRAKE